MLERVAVNEVRRFIKSTLKVAGGLPDQCEDLADILIAADSRGHYSHGLNRLEMYCDDYLRGTTSITALPSVQRETVSTALVNGNNSLGATVGKFCMRKAMEKCKSTGVGVVTAKGSNHYGIAGYYGLMAKDEGLIGISMTNTSPLLVPTRGKTATLGTNPIAVVAPGQADDYFALDMATSTVALGKIEVSKRKGEEIPEGWGCDSEGQQTTVPERVLDGGGLFPLGGTELAGGYKGYGLAMVVELLCGILSGATWGSHIRPWKGQGPEGVYREADLGQFFMALDPEVFGDGFGGRLQQMMDEHRSLEPIEGKESVLVAGDPERAAVKDVAESGGIVYHAALIRDMAELAKKFSVDPMKTLIKPVE